MKTSSLTRAALVAMLLALPGGASAGTLDSHEISVDGGGNLLSWVTPQENAYDRVMFLSWDLLLNRIPVDPETGVSLIAFNSEYDATTFSGTTWPNNPAGKNAMLSDAARLKSPCAMSPAGGCELSSPVRLLQGRMRQRGMAKTHPDNP